MVLKGPLFHSVTAGFCKVEEIASKAEEGRRVISAVWKNTGESAESPLSGAACISSYSGQGKWLVSGIRPTTYFAAHANLKGKVRTLLFPGSFLL